MGRRAVDAGNTAREIVPSANVPFRFFWDLIIRAVALVIVLLFGPKKLIRDKHDRDTIEA